MGTPAVAVHGLVSRSLFGLYGRGLGGKIDGARYTWQRVYAYSVFAGALLAVKHEWTAALARSLYTLD